MDMSDTNAMTANVDLQIKEETYSKALSVSLETIIAVQSIKYLRLIVHETSGTGMTDAQHRLLRRLFGQAEANEQAVEIVKTITGDNATIRFRSMSKQAASAIIEELMDAGTKSITQRGAMAISGIKSLIEAFPVFEERDAYIERVASDMCLLRRTYNAGTRDARSYPIERERARKLLSRGSNQYRRELRPDASRRQEPRLLSFQIAYESGKRKGHKTPA
jgi:hypothetical protein